MSAEFIVETSARHVHVTQETLEILFGKGATLTKKKDLSQPGQFASEQRVEVVGPKKLIRLSFPLQTHVPLESLLLSERAATLQVQVHVSWLAPAAR